ncbi:MAG TPA: bifunctional DNA-formamidopyrimidine glycosylase/DNA-(apurinic or apyrimidinic site) lyase [Terriglobia bacterium]|nr:bifunctional DNA-formamidopyrimidine glycosylase/DNA-(apurinic or apyrimidinic site) lyase [Terriglobia bacterium]
MPELPEVETVLRGLKKRILGRWLGAAEVRHHQVIAGSPDDFVQQVSGRRILSAQRKGKAIAIELGPRNEDEVAHKQYLLVRLGMTGQFTINSIAEPLEPHTHVRLRLEDGDEEIRYVDARRFGRLRCLMRAELDKVFGGLGPDARRITEEQFQETLRGRRSPLKSWLMNQQFLAGVGNIYADESLYLARLNPLMEAGRLSAEQSRRLLRAVKRVLDHAVELQGTSFRDYIDIEGRPGNFLPQLRVYQRTGKPCRRCRQPIERVIISGRSSHFCPQCQPRPRRRAPTGRTKSRSEA